jgi:hypothetical protein
MIANPNQVCPEYLELPRWCIKFSVKLRVSELYIAMQCGKSAARIRIYRKMGTQSTTDYALNQVGTLGLPVTENGCHLQ